ncbi:hypothetical protein INR49_007089 [Caranx melampygus]|nr:hypothetical protein INR49_007089 [Caranx melampygus]
MSPSTPTRLSLPPSHLPHPSLPPAHLTSSLQTQNQTETPPPPPQSESPAHPPLLPQSGHTPTPPPPLHPQSIPGAVPLQKLSQLYQDPLYPGFPLGEKGTPAPPPPFSSSKSGDDLPQDVNILRFFFNLGVKDAFTLLLPHPPAPALLQPPTPHQEAYPPYPPTSAPMLPPHYDHHHQPPPAEPPRQPSEPSYSQAGYPVTQPPPPPHRMPGPSLTWQQMPPPRNYPGAYSTPPPPYSALPPSSQGYHHGQGQGPQLYPPGMPPYPPSSLGYQSSSTPDDLQVSQGLMEQLQPLNGDSMPGHGPGRAPGSLEGPAAANMANANNNRTMVVQNSYGMKKTQGETKAVLLVDPPLNNRPIVALVSNSDSPDVSMVTMKPSNSSPGSPLPYSVVSKVTVSGDNNTYRLHQKSFSSNKQFVPLGAPEPRGGGHLSTVAMTEVLSVGCSTEDDWQEMEGFKPPIPSHRGSRRPFRGRGRGGSRRRPGGDAGMGYNHGNHAQFVSSHRGGGW